jgi:hypothetical protein
MGTTDIEVNLRAAAALQVSTERDTLALNEVILKSELKNAPYAVLNSECLLDIIFSPESRLSQVVDQVLSAKVIRTTRSKLHWTDGVWKGAKESQVHEFLNSGSCKVFKYSGIDKSIILEGAPELPVDGIEKTVKIDAFIGPCRNRQISTKEGPHIYQLHVVIELKQPSNSAARNILFKYIDQIFIGLPNRILVHGMTIAGSKMRFYVFDRGSVYQSKAYDCVDDSKS